MACHHHCLRSRAIAGAGGIWSQAPPGRRDFLGYAGAVALAVGGGLAGFALGKQQQAPGAAGVDETERKDIGKSLFIIVLSMSVANVIENDCF